MGLLLCVKKIINLACQNYINNYPCSTANHNCNEGVVISFSNGVKGGKITIVSSLCLGLYFIILGGIKDIDAVLIFSLPFLVPGIFLYYLKT